MHYICIKTNSYLQPILKFAPLKVPESPMETYKRFFLVSVLIYAQKTSCKSN